MKNSNSKNKVNGIKLHNCEKCKKSFSRKAMLNAHVKRVHKKPPENYHHCPCGAILEDFEKLALHIKTVHENKNVTKIQCKICEKWFSSKDKLNSHIQDVHQKSKFQCQMCDEKFITPYNLNLHYKYTHNLTKVPTRTNLVSGDEKNSNKKIDNAINDKNKCKLCSETFKTNQNLRKHVLSVHEKLFKFDCTKCDKKFPRKDNLDYHFKSIHANNVKNEASKCAKVKLHQCPNCWYQFKSKASLKKHVETAHSKTSKFHCDHCNYQGSTKQDLQLHCENRHGAKQNNVKKDTTNDTFSCTLCTKRFSQEVHLQFHLKSDHPPKVASTEPPIKPPRKNPVTIKIQKTYSMSTKVSTSDRRESNLSNGTTSNESNDVENTFFDDEEPFVGGDDMIEIKNEPIFREDDEEDIIDQPQEQAITDDVIPDIVVQPVIMPNNEIFNFDKTVDIGPDLRDDDDVEEETILGF